MTTRHPYARWLAAVLLLFSWLSAAPAVAQSDKAAAEALFTQARALTQQGRYAEACPKFEASQQLDAGLGTLLYLADCYEKAERLASAWATFQEAASLAEARGDKERASIAKVRASALEPQLLRLQIDVPATLATGFEVRRNGNLVPRAALGTAVPVDAGTWLITASAPGYKTYEVSVSLQQSDPKQPYVLSIPALEPEPAAPVAAADTTAPASTPGGSGTSTLPSETTAPSRGSQRTLGLIIGSAGLVSAVVSTIFTVMANGSNNNSLDNCDPNLPNSCSVIGKRDRDAAQNQAAIATVAGIVGGVAIAAGTTLYFTAPSDNQAAMLKLEGQW